MSDLAILVDEQDNEIGTRHRHELQKGDIIRISSVWVENGKGEALLQKRSLKKIHDPGLWAAAAAGTLEPGETYESNVYKELEEEIGITNVPLKLLKHWMFWRNDGTGRYVSMYKAMVDKPAREFVIQKEEVEEVAWFKKSELLNELSAHPEKFAGSASFWRDLFLHVS